MEYRLLDCRHGRHLTSQQSATASRNALEDLPIVTTEDANVSDSAFTAADLDLGGNREIFTLCRLLSRGCVRLDGDSSRRSHVRRDHPWNCQGWVFTQLELAEGGGR